MGLAAWLSKLHTVHRARTAEEREKIYRFRYDCYVREFGRRIPGADHDREIVVDAYDEDPSTLHLYAGSIDNLSASGRLLIWPAGQVPPSEFEALGMHEVPGIESLGSCEVGRMAIAPAKRGNLLFPSLLRAGYQVLAEETDTDLVFMTCMPGLVGMYRRAGCRPYTSTLFDAGDGFEVPLMLAMCDVEHLQRVDAPMADLAKKLVKSGAVRKIDLGSIHAAFARASTQVQTNPKRVSAELEETAGQLGQLDGTIGHHTAGFLPRLPEQVRETLKTSGFIVDVPTATELIVEGLSQREMFVVLDGELEVVIDDKRVATVPEGELVGEVGFFRESGKRSAAIRAIAPSRVLVIRRRFVAELIASDPRAAALLLMELGRTMAERLAVAAPMES